MSCDICPRLHSVEICKTFNLSAMQFSRRGYLPDVDVAVTYLSSTFHDRLLFLSPAHASSAPLIIDSVCYLPPPPRVISFIHKIIVPSQFNY